MAGDAKTKAVEMANAESTGKMEYVRIKDLRGCRMRRGSPSRACSTATAGRRNVSLHTVL
ncbi:hypothetical protein MesoLj113c_35440 [Mesorhizobium sp. 113-3-9]|nr:hypothetical protein MesoLj113c_35440 [Mesorhizobium sp. 113-3-9]